MVADRECYDCCKNKAESLLEQYQVSEALQQSVMKEVEEVLQKAQPGLSAPLLMAQMMSVLDMHINIGDAYAEPKKKYNRFLLEREKAVREDIGKSRDRFLAGLQYAVTGNYIDFGAMSDVNEEKLLELLDNHESIRLDGEETACLRRDLSSAERLVYITDNAGEIVLDKIFITTLKELYPDLQISVIVRGFPILNDATEEDASFAGLTEVVPVFSNGTDIPGTPLEEISEEALEQIEKADLCIAKGQGNFESLRGSGKNIYYLFLCKCELFVRKFQVERFTPVLANETRIVQYN